ncbi:MAG: hypothetical protein A3G52_00825 [Candidatus Taylorbacteria bacterium RIFCSPLOWO2_12_FULL_43_20]|uniref:Carbonic anhydrase n=1 Tax=Candidatus Taylorbacteria bacterium RIFCSPLOWO2_12_FULL_43_20 TaxID=1802332 RepID=A0A1G2NZI6_9BACT|nr:MAG: hypothetical protein A2825_03270 [Candidatus Taylorbacteria bacterium RIFCSPHIGHO2_01_FULL_43_120]OHA23701.1 MAG: hypothetical protein A3B98_00675 [Candidatus Taylorbacteria bacterium RIFCSPHIGHO2_02_FULL_43_55]OHA27954.1 MAG: hypothetical protein A3E92_02990 [Candidatus Taylorbacteria bacterium RIFCSPHIGHO2_12_FULL_42_34]OHA32049.1 MAG: hypothetical protein A3B09_02870 [Candidatus Taylorbacteria bacterium RIFCSPLOWO2_01_FULL_43_83]OHA39799.1 MAG: hypothetical protein A3H58_03645 [Candi
MKKHTCKNFIIHCIDFRFQKAHEELISKLGINYGDFDRVAVAGGAGNFEQLRTHAEISNRLHDTDTVILTIHEDCGAGAKKEDFTKAKEIANEFFSQVKLVHINLDGSIEEL